MGTSCLNEKGPFQNAKSEGEKRHILALTVINKEAIHTDLTALFEGLSLKPLLALCHF